jgi:Family of unknown function (DUF6428)
MLALAKPYPETAAFAAGEISLGALLETLRPQPEKQLVFVYDGREVLSGYHVTEIKSGQFESLDCGATPEAWRETFIQLWDVPEEGRTHMTAGKFLAILRKVDQSLPLDPGAKLTFEVSDGASPMAIYKAGRVLTGETQIRVELAHRPSSCKPRDRWLEEQKNAAACCGPAQSNEPCCA